MEATDDDGFTALHLAAGAGHLDVVEYLVEELGADVAATNDAGDTALDVAAAEGHTAVVAYLEPLAAVEEPVAEARTPEEARAALAALGLDFTEEAFSDFTSEFWLEDDDATTVVMLFVYAGMDVNAKNDDGWTALHFAAGGGSLADVQ